jgi:hypothetical protein
MTSGSSESDIGDIVAVVNATGFSSSPALEFMPKSILDTLGYDASCPRLPLLLHRDALTSSNNSPNNLALMGSFDGSYWGVLETQARVIAKKWAHDENQSAPEYSQANKKSAELYSHMKEIRSIMHNDSSKIPQNFFGDYPGLMEETSRSLGLRRIDLLWGAKEGMVSPARYVNKESEAGEAEITMRKLQITTDTSNNLQAFSAKAAFRALQGKWKIESIGSLDPVMKALPTIGIFHSRYPTDSTSDLEYIFILHIDQPNESVSPSSHDLQKRVYRLRESENIIEVWNVSLGVTADKIHNTIEFNTATSDKQNCLSVRARSATTLNQHTTSIYSFYFAGVHITKFTIQTYSGDQPRDRSTTLEFSRTSG